MKLLADENIEYRIIANLNKKGFDIKSVADVSPSISDIKVLKLAVKEQRILLTNDKDFGDLVVRQKLSHVGVVLVRISTEDVNLKTDALIELLTRYRDKIYGNFVVISDNKIRFKKA